MGKTDVPERLGDPALRRREFLGVVAAASGLARGESAWKPLCNGRDLDGWWWWEPEKGSPPEPSWTVENGILRTTPENGTRVYLITKESFTDFELSWDWKIEKAGNSGIKYRFQRLSLDGERPEPTGLEYQMSDDESNPDAVSDPKHATAAVYEYIAAKKPRMAKPDVWHTGRIVARGLHIEHWLDGTKVVDIELDSDEAAAGFAASKRRSAPMLRKQERRSSQIALQYHDGLVWFRDLKIRTI